MSPILFVILGIYVVMIAITLMQVDYTLRYVKKINADIAMAMNTFLLSTYGNYFLCQYANSVTVSSLNVAIELYDLEWYKFGIAEQQLLRLWIQYAQRDFYFKGFGVITCSRETFLTV